MTEEERIRNTIRKLHLTRWEVCGVAIAMTFMLSGRHLHNINLVLNPDDYLQQKSITENSDRVQQCGLFRINKATLQHQSHSDIQTSL